MKKSVTPTKQKSTLKTKKQAKITIQQQLPYYLCQEPPLFLEKDRTKQDGYFDDKKQMLSSDIKKCQQLLEGFIAGEKETLLRIQQLTQFTQENAGNFNSSLPFYSCKNIIFNQYLICLKFYQLFRLNSVDFTSGPGLNLYQRLVYLKTLILKLAPVEKKLQYQKNKLLKKGQKIKVKQYNQRKNDQDEQQKGLQDQQQNEVEKISQSQEQVQSQQQQQQSQKQEDKLAYRPMVKSLMADKIKKKKQIQKDGKYIAPKQSAVLSGEQKKKRRQERQVQRRKAFLLRKFRGDIQQRDQAQQKHMLQGIDERFKKKYEQKLRYEEQNFTRLNQTKKQKYLKKQAIKNRFSKSLNDQIDQIALIRELVDQEGSHPKRPNIAPIHPPKPQKKRKIQ